MRVFLSIVISLIYLSVTLLFYLTEIKEPLMIMTLPWSFIVIIFGWTIIHTSSYSMDTWMFGGAILNTVLFLCLRHINR
ncbi:MAG: hypothetical protein KF855_14860 [Acidobacteria bacterium]|nr:hypothetical protein [Acidobacteriota bacterium]